MNNYYPSALTIAGSDSGGGAGVQADLRTFHSFNVYGCSVITAVTSQNPDEVRRVDVLPAESVRTQLESVLDAIPLRFAKTGMLAKSEIIECTAETVQKYHLQLIIDPVMISTSGTRLLEDSAISALQNKLFPLAKWITPNIPEAELLCGKSLKTPETLVEAARELYEQFHCNVILKSGHAITCDSVTDIVCHEGTLYSAGSPVAKVNGNTAHGTGCTLSAALTANLALGKDWQNAFAEAKAFVYGSLLESVRLNENLSQMYPPKKNYFNQVRLEKL